MREWRALECTECAGEAPVREWRTLESTGALPCETGARWALRGRSRVGVVHCGEFAGAPMREWCFLKQLILLSRTAYIYFLEACSY